jgi:DNA-binding transcriptional LysR family regulator
MDVHLRNLRYFVAVAEELHFSHAAERLHVSQPALSKQIRHLEQELRVSLFVRDRHKVSLSAAGAALLPGAQKLLADWEEAHRTAMVAATERDNLLRVGFKTSVGGSLFQESSERFHAEHPDWRLAMRLQPWSDSTAGLLSGDADVAFLWLPTGAEDKIETLLLRRERRFVALPEGHPLAGTAVFHFSDLLDEAFVALPEAAGPTRNFWLATHERDGREAIVGAEAETPDEAFEAVIAGSGILLMAEGNTHVYRRPGLVYRLVVDLSPARLAVAWRRGDRRESVHAFVASALEVAKTEQLPSATT